MAPMGLVNSRRNPTNRLISIACSTLLLTVARSLSTVAVPQFTSCASPKFDVFSEKLIGEWQWTQDGSLRVESVEEVMRSCGGAVQGIREIPTLTSTKLESSEEDEGYYLNRANDGFVYFDNDGSYSFGPIKETSDQEQDGPWISSLSVGKTRLLLRMDDVKLDACKRLQVCRKSSGDPVENTNDSFLDKLPENIVWHKAVRCRMPSPSMPWMSNRLKWEKCVLEESNDDDDDDSNKEASNMMTWACRTLAADDPVIKAILEDCNDSVVWSAGALCMNTGIAKSILRQYSEADGSLHSVTWAEGRLQTEELAEQ